ncbi:hypothetical protein [Dyella terrae]|uniref:hypothetical protein n=1 Tax=Dyella terrae TaxID=522259 RepID=UPI001EFE4DA3|nr:hypothetical protein [Dyella terrae]ULU25264.1 hypothetical protein DYST_02188 [Dyella terrae]
MKRFCLISIALWVVIARNAAGQDAPKGLPSLTIKQADNVPAACLPIHNEALPLLGAAVGPLDGEWPPEEWAIVRQPSGKAFILKPGECITYGATLNGYRQEGGGHPLVAGATYEFIVRSGDKPSRWDEGLFLSVFCIEQQADGSRRILPYVLHDDGTATYPRCGRYIGWKAAPNSFIPSDYPASRE